MNRQDQISSFVWFFIGLLIVVGSVTSLKIGTVSDPGAGFCPLLAGILLTGFSLVIFLMATFEKISEKNNLRQLWAGLNWPKIVYTMIALLSYALLLETAGFLLVTLLLFVFLLRKIEPQKWKLVVGLSVIASVGAYLIFDRLLQIQLPRGVLGF